MVMLKQETAFWRKPTQNITATQYNVHKPNATIIIKSELKIFAIQQVWKGPIDDKNYTKW